MIATPSKGYKGGKSVRHLTSPRPTLHDACMRKLFVGIIIGLAAAYFLDPERGGERRARLLNGWQEQKDTVLEAARSTAGAVSSVSHDVGGKVSEFRARSGEAGNGKAADATLEKVSGT